MLEDMDQTNRSSPYSEMTEDGDTYENGVLGPVVDGAETDLMTGPPEIGEADIGTDEYVAVDEAASGSDPQFIEHMRHQADLAEKSVSAPNFNYKYTSEDTYTNEVDDWYDYKDNSLLGEAVSEYHESVSKPWTESTTSEKQELIAMLVSQLPSCSSDDWNDEAMTEDAKRSLLLLTYISQGSFNTALSLQKHITQIRENCILLIDAFTPVYDLVRTLISNKIPEEYTFSEPDPSDEQDIPLLLALTILYMMIETLKDQEQFINMLSCLKTPIISYFVDIIGRLRWAETPDLLLPTRKITLLLWKCILCLFGDHKKLLQAKQLRRIQLGLPDDEEEYDRNVDLITASPFDYHAFREDIISRYPSYVPPASVVPKGLENTNSLTHFIEVSRPSHVQPSNAQLPAPIVHLATPAPSPPPSPMVMAGQKLKKSVFMTNQSFPFLFPSDSGEVPKSTVEASELFSSRVRMTPTMQQLWDERDNFMKYERGWIIDDKCQAEKKKINVGFEDVAKRLDRVEQFYAGNYTKLHSFVNVMLRLILQNIIFIQGGDTSDADSKGASEPLDDGTGGIDFDPVSIRSNELAVKSVSAIFELLTSWFKVSHVLKFEFLAAVLFDSRYYLLVYKYLYSHSVVDRALSIPDSIIKNFFTVCRDLSAGSSNSEYGLTACRDQPLLNSSSLVLVDAIEPFNKRYFFTLINLTRILKRIIKKKVQRIVMVAELPSETLKKTLTVHQNDLWRVVLEIFKEQVPFNGKKWKYNNMEVISHIYLHCRAKLRDEWLSRSDVSAELDDAYAQEVAIRALVQFYNDRNYIEGFLTGVQEEIDALVLGD